jgi:pimeloyl-ACP methyl ester carboxylesterase
MTVPPRTLDLAVTTQGAGLPVVVLHGLLGRARNWLSVARALEPSFAVHLVDLRNHGASPWSDEMGYRAMAGDVAALIERLAAGPVRLVGHSMGGKVAMALALIRPELVERLIVVDIAPVPYRHGYEPFIDAMQAVDLASLRRRADADLVLVPAVPDAGMRGFLLQNLSTVDGRLTWQPNLAVLRATMPEITGFPAELLDRRFEGRAWCLRGARSDYVDAAGEAALQRLFPSIRIASIPGAGHWPHAEQPAAFLGQLGPVLAA